MLAAIVVVVVVVGEASAPIDDFILNTQDQAVAFARIRPQLQCFKLTKTD